MGTPTATFKAKFDPDTPGSKAAALRKNMAFATKELSAAPSRDVRVSLTAHPEDVAHLRKLHR